jgi:hypothetical protein
VPPALDFLAEGYVGGGRGQIRPRADKIESVTYHTIMEQITDINDAELEQHVNNVAAFHKHHPTIFKSALTITKNICKLSLLYSHLQLFETLYNIPNIEFASDMERALYGYETKGSERHTLLYFKDIAFYIRIPRKELNSELITSLHWYSGVVYHIMLENEDKHLIFSCRPHCIGQILTYINVLFGDVRVLVNDDQVFVDIPRVDSQSYRGSFGVLMNHIDTQKDFDCRESTHDLACKWISVGNNYVKRYLCNDAMPTMFQIHLRST